MLVPTLYICFNIVCDKMTFGLECAFNCSKCRNGTACHHVNGTCIHGCSDGLYGDMCNEDLNILLQQRVGALSFIQLKCH